MLRVRWIATRVLTREAALCTEMTTLFANQPTLRVGQFAIRVLKHEGVLFYYTIHTCPNRPTQRIRLFCNTFFDAQSGVVYCSVQKMSQINRGCASVDVLHVCCFETRVLTREAVFCYCTIQACHQSIGDARRSICDTCVECKAILFYCTVDTCWKSTDAECRLIFNTWAGPRTGRSHQPTFRVGQCDYPVWRERGPCVRWLGSGHKLKHARTHILTRAGNCAMEICFSCVFEQRVGAKLLPSTYSSA